MKIVLFRKKDIREEGDAFFVLPFSRLRLYSFVSFFLASSPLHSVLRMLYEYLRDQRVTRGYGPMYK